MALAVDFKLTGVTPLVMHYDNLEWQDNLQAWLADPDNKRLSRPGDDRTPPWAWRGYVYSDGAHVCCPWDNLARALVVGATAVPSGKGQKTLKDAAAGGFYFPEPHFRLTAAGGKQVKVADLEKLHKLPFAEQALAVQRLGFKLLCKRARVGQAKHVRVRPFFEEWAIAGRVEVTDPATLTEERVRMIFAIAGKRGLMDWRPSAPKSPGPYGQFRAPKADLKFSEVPDSLAA